MTTKGKINFAPKKSMTIKYCIWTHKNLEILNDHKKWYMTMLESKWPLLLVYDRSYTHKSGRIVCWVPKNLFWIFFFLIRSYSILKLIALDTFRFGVEHWQFYRNHPTWLWEPLIWIWSRESSKILDYNLQDLHMRNKHMAHWSRYPIFIKQLFSAVSLPILMPNTAS